MFLLIDIRQGENNQPDEPNDRQTGHQPDTRSNYNTSPQHCLSAAKAHPCVCRKAVKKTERNNMKRIFNLLVVDESGNMEIIRKQAFAGINETLETIKAMQEQHKELEQRVTLITFDSSHNKTIYDNTPADKAHKLSWADYSPCGGTPLYDAIGMGISKTNAQTTDGDTVLVTINTSPTP